MTRTVALRNITTHRVTTITVTTLDDLTNLLGGHLLLTPDVARAAAVIAWNGETLTLRSTIICTPTPEAAHAR